MHQTILTLYVEDPAGGFLIVSGRDLSRLGLGPQDFTGASRRRGNLYALSSGDDSGKAIEFMRGLGYRVRVLSHVSPAPAFVRAWPTLAGAAQAA